MSGVKLFLSRFVLSGAGQLCGQSLSTKVGGALPTFLPKWIMISSTCNAITFIGTKFFCWLEQTIFYFFVSLDSMFSFLAAFVVVVVVIDVAVMIIIDVVLHSPDSSNGHLTLKTHFLLLIAFTFNGIWSHNHAIEGWSVYHPGWKHSSVLIIKLILKNSWQGLLHKI